MPPCPLLGARFLPPASQRPLLSIAPQQQQPPCYAAGAHTHAHTTTKKSLAWSHVLRNPQCPHFPRHKSTFPASAASLRPSNGSPENGVVHPCVADTCAHARAPTHSHTSSTPSPLSPLLASCAAPAARLLLATGVCLTCCVFFQLHHAPHPRGPLQTLSKPPHPYNDVMEHLLQGAEGAAEAPKKAGTRRRQQRRRGYACPFDACSWRLRPSPLGRDASVIAPSLRPLPSPLPSSPSSSHEQVRDRQAGARLEGPGGPARRGDR